MATGGASTDTADAAGGESAGNDALFAVGTATLSMTLWSASLSKLWSADNDAVVAVGTATGVAVDKGGADTFDAVVGSAAEPLGGATAPARNDVEPCEDTPKRRPPLRAGVAMLRIRRAGATPAAVGLAAPRPNAFGLLPSGVALGAS